MCPCAGAAAAPEGAVLLPAAARSSDPPQQGAPAEERHVRQTHAQEQTQDQEDGETGQRSQHLPQMKEGAGGDTSLHVAAQDCINSSL